ncbi:MAG: hypothetical protein O3C60_09905 [Planctomycetota bacterium]|nr:hypothetical protein [Planctomycetota bacterium]
MFIHHRYTKGNRRLARSGISLIEILMSIGVLLIGLLGVVALFPAGQHRAQQSSMEDRKSLGGRRAVREFSIRDMDDTSNWIYNSQAPHPANPADRRQSFCVDPRLFFSDTVAQQKEAWMFPFGGNPYEKSGNNESIGFMQRVSLKADTSAELPADPTTHLQYRMTRAQAEHVFAFENDLLFVKPDDTMLPVEQATIASNATPLKRQADGHFTWLATLVPEPTSDSDYYHLSVVVSHKRLLQDPTLTPLDPESVAENVVRVVDGSGTGLSGGDLQLEVTQDSLPAWLHLQSLQPGDWLILHQRRQLSGGPFMSYFRWYRVAAAEEAPNIKTLPGNVVNRRRMVTLQGPDWPGPLVAHTAILVRNVVAVYEKTIRLEQ